MLVVYKMVQYHLQLDLLCTPRIDHGWCIVYVILVVYKMVQYHLQLDLLCTPRIDHGGCIVYIIC